MPRQGGTQGGGRASSVAAPALAFQPVHRLAFVQHLMRSGYMLESSALDTFEQLTGHRDEEAFHNMVGEQNKLMDTLGLQIRLLSYPIDKQKYIGFINTMSDEPSKLATHYSHGQREFFKHVLETIAIDTSAEGGVGSASSVHLLNLEIQPAAAGEGEEAEAAAKAAAQAAKKLTKTEREQTLRQLVADGWLRHSDTQSGHYCIGVHSFMELSDMLLSFDLPESTRMVFENIL